MTNILKKIIEKKVERVKFYKKKYSTSEILQKILKIIIIL